MPQSPVKSLLFVSQIIAGAGISVTPANGTGQVTVTATEGDPSNVAITGGNINGTKIGGTTPAEGIFSELKTSGNFITSQGAPAAKTTSGALGAADVLAGIITVTQGSGANSNQQMPTGTALQGALPADFAIGDSFTFSIINLGGASETATLTVNTDVTIAGRAVVDVAAASASGSGLFKVRKTADHVFVVYRIA